MKFRKSYCTIPGIGVGGAAAALVLGFSKFLKFHFKVFKILYFLNPLFDLNYIRSDDRYWFKLLLSTSPIPGHALQVKVMDLEILC